MDQEQVFTGGFPSCAQYPHDVLIYTSEESSFAIFIHTASLMMRFFFLVFTKGLGSGHLISSVIWNNFLHADR